MKKSDLFLFRDDVDRVIRERKSLGEFNADAKYMMFLLQNMRTLIDHAIDKYPKGEKKV